MSFYTREIYKFYSESEVQYFSFLGVDNVQISSLNCHMSLEEASGKLWTNPYEDCLTVTNNDDISHLIAYKFEVSIPKKENISLTEDGLKNETNSISFGSSTADEVNTYFKNDDYILEFMFYPSKLQSNSSKSFYFNKRGISTANVVHISRINYVPIQYRGSKVLNFSCAFNSNKLYPLIIFYNFEKPFINLDPYDNEGYLISISFLDSGNYTFSFVHIWYPFIKFRIRRADFPYIQPFLY